MALLQIERIINFQLFVSTSIIDTMFNRNVNIQNLTLLYWHHHFKLTNTRLILYFFNHVIRQSLTHQDSFYLLLRCFFFIDTNPGYKFWQHSHFNPRKSYKCMDLILLKRRWQTYYSKLKERYIVTTEFNRM